ncbi:MAG: hypothetical protein IPP64_11780 [Bacteroidetes bacterium]|nr:hypothetical protein [Bacteroidota bacterium]
MCKGHCPGTSMGYDWRNRTEDCSLFKQLFSHLEEGIIKKGIQPLSLHRNRKEIELNFIKGLTEGNNIPLHRLSANINPDNILSLEKTPFFLRWSWSSNKAKKIWEERIEKINNILPLIYAECIKRSLLPYIVITIKPWQFFQLLSELKKSDIAIAAMEGSLDSQNKMMVMIGTKEKLEVLKLRIKESLFTNLNILNSPLSCCTASSLNCAYNYGVPGLNSFLGKGSGTNEIHLPQDWRMNRLLSDVGLSLLPYTPCTLECSKSLVLSEEIFSIGNNQYPKEMEWLKQLLNVSVKYSLLHGILEIKTPIFKYITKTLYTAAKYDFNYQGSSDIAEESYGTKFLIN